MLWDLARKLLPTLWTLLCVVKALKQPEETAGEVALKAAPDLSAGFAFGRASSDVVLGLRVEAGATDSDHVQGSVQARSPCRFKRCRTTRPLDAGTGATPAMAAKAF